MTRVRVLYVGGSGRSGSTVLEQLLTAREETVAVGEIRYLWRRGLVDDQLCSCGTPIRSCDFWTDVLTTALGAVPSVAEAAAIDDDARLVDRVRFIPALAVPALRRAGLRDRLDRHQRRVAAVYRAAAAVSGATIVLDSSKDPSYAFLLAANGDLDVDVLHLVRDSRAVAHSWTRKKRRPEIHWETQYMRQHPPVHTARQWLVTNALFEALRRTHGRVRRVRYEDFAAHPVGVVGGIAAWAGISAHETAAPVHHSVSGNPSRFDASAPIRVDDEWRRALGARDRRVVTAVTAPLLLAYGYIGPRASGA